MDGLTQTKRNEKEKKKKREKIKEDLATMTKHHPDRKRERRYQAVFVSSLRWIYLDITIVTQHSNFFLSSYCRVSSPAIAGQWRANVAIKTSLVAPHFYYIRSRN